jgi:large subunit ribosomal protein L9
MKVILIKDNDKLGKKNEIKNVSDGYARNFLIPNRLAIFADDSTIYKIKQAELQYISQKKEIDHNKHDFIQKISEKELIFELETSKTGTLFSSLSKKQIVDEINRIFKFELKDDNIISDEIVKKTGNYDISINLGNDYKCKIKVIIKSKNEPKKL